MSYLVMDDFHRLFLIDSQCRVLICTDCQYAVVPAQMGKHLRTHHKRLTLQQRRDIISAVDRLPILARVPSDVTYPSPSDPPVANIPVYFDGMKCSSVDPRGVPCLYICRTPRGIREHCEQKHGWVNSQKRGGDTRSKQTHAKNKIWTENHACQRFFKVGIWQHYFEVARQDIAANPERQASRKHDFFQAQEDDIQAAERDAIEDADRVQGFDMLKMIVECIAGG